MAYTYIYTYAHAHTYLDSKFPELSVGWVLYVALWSGLSKQLVKTWLTQMDPATRTNNPYRAVHVSAPCTRPAAPRAVEWAAVMDERVNFWVVDYVMGIFS